MRRAIALASFVLTLVVLAMFVQTSRSTTSSLTGTFKDAQQQPLTGYITLRLPVPAVDTSTSTAVSPSPIRCNVVSGALVNCPPVYDVANLQPQNLYYQVAAYDTSGTPTGFAANIVITGTPFNLTAAVPTSVTTSNISYINPATLTGNNTWTGSNTFTQPIISTVSTGTAPLQIASTTVVPNLNVSDLNGCVVSGTPATGQLLTATSSTTCNWQSASNVTASYVNQNVTGTVAGQLAKLTGAPSTAVQSAITDTSGIIGICLSGCGVTSSAAISTVGLASCIFDAATVAGDYVQNSPTIAGNCHDAGASYPGSGQVLGRVLSTNGGAGTYNMTLFGTEIQGAVPSKTVASFTNKNLGGSVALVANTLTVLDSQAVTMPAAGGPWRAQVCYIYYHNASSGVSVGESYVTDGTSIFAEGNDPIGGANGGGYWACGWSPGTAYANGANITFTVKAENGGAQTVQTTSQLIGRPSHVAITVVSSN